MFRTGGDTETAAEAGFGIVHEFPVLHCPGTEDTPANTEAAGGAVARVGHCHIVRAGNEILTAIHFKELEVMAATVAAAAQCIDPVARHEQGQVDKTVLIRHQEPVGCFHKRDTPCLPAENGLLCQVIDQETDVPGFIAPAIMGPAQTVRQGKGASFREYLEYLFPGEYPLLRLKGLLNGDNL